MATSRTYRGHPIEPAGPDKPWRYVDTKGSIAGSDRPCGHCGEPRTPEGHDPCIARLPGVMNACCGHGKSDEAYVQFPPGRVVVRGRMALALARALRVLAGVRGYLASVSHILHDDDDGR